EIPGIILTDGLAQLAATGIVGSDGKIPVAIELTVQIPEKAGCRPGRFFEIAAFIAPPVVLQTKNISGALNKLPGAGGMGPAVSAIVESRLYHSQVSQILGQAFFRENLSHHGEIASRTLKPKAKSGRTASGVIIDEIEDFFVFHYG